MTGAIIGLELGPIGFLGIALGICAGLFGAAGTWLGGIIADWVGNRDLKNYMTAPAIASVLSFPLYAGAILASTAELAFALLALNFLISAFWLGPVYSTVQSVVPANMRATAAAALLFLINLLGYGLGPLFIGATSDVLNLLVGLGEGEGIRWALVAASSTTLIAALCFWLARNSLERDTVS